METQESLDNNIKERHAEINILMLVNSEENCCEICNKQPGDLTVESSDEVNGDALTEVNVFLFCFYIYNLEKFTTSRT